MIIALLGVADAAAYALHSLSRCVMQYVYSQNTHEASSIEYINSRPRRCYSYKLRVAYSSHSEHAKVLWIKGSLALHTHALHVSTTAHSTVHMLALLQKLYTLKYYQLPLQLVAVKLVHMHALPSSRFVVRAQALKSAKQAVRARLRFLLPKVISHYTVRQALLALCFLSYDRLVHCCVLAMYRSQGADAPCTQTLLAAKADDGLCLDSCVPLGRAAVPLCLLHGGANQGQFLYSINQPTALVALIHSVFSFPLSAGVTASIMKLLIYLTYTHNRSHILLESANGAAAALGIAVQVLAVHCVLT
eukprot:2326-Heterococcus_DN1.PRE.1